MSGRLSLGLCSHLTRCGGLPPCQEGVASCRPQSTCCATHFHVFTVKPFSRSKCREKSFPKVYQIWYYRGGGVEPKADGVGKINFASWRQYASATKAGCECVGPILQTWMNLDPQATMMSIGLVSVRAIWSPASQCSLAGMSFSILWDVSTGTHQQINGRTRWAQPRTHKERKGSEATRFMTVLFVLGQHTVLEAFPARTRAGENEMAHRVSTRAVGGSALCEVAWNPVRLSAYGPGWEGPRIFIGQPEFVREFQERKTRELPEFCQRTRGQKSRLPLLDVRRHQGQLLVEGGGEFV